MTSRVARQPKPCPGQCNGDWREAEAKAGRLQARLDAKGRTRYLQREVEILVHGIEPVAGEPVWCRECSSQIYLELCRLPELAVALWQVGHTGEQCRPMRVVQMRCLTHGPAVPSDPSSARVVVGYTELLSCGHLLTRVRGSEPPPGFTPRMCLQCALEDPGDSGRLVAVAAPAARRSASRPGSPALSSSWLAVEELVDWVCRTEDYLRARRGDGASSVDWWTGDYSTRHRAMTLALGYLARHIEDLLATPHAAAIGHELLGLASRARAASGTAGGQRLARPCPVCDQRSLWWDFLSATAHCRSCKADTVIDEDEYLRPAALEERA